MAKRSSRRTRKTSKAVQPISIVDAATASDEAATPITTGKRVDYVDDYYYVFTDLRTMIIITLLMIALMFGLTFFI